MYIRPAEDYDFDNMEEFSKLICTLGGPNCFVYHCFYYNRPEKRVYQSQNYIAIIPIHVIIQCGGRKKRRPISENMNVCNCV